MADFLDRIRKYQTGLTNPVRLPGGWQAGNVLEIANRYSTPGQFQGAPNTSGAAGPTGLPSAASPPAPSAFDPIPQPPGPAQYPPPGSTPPAQGVPAPAKNFRQRWMEQGGSNHTLNRANVARGVRPAIDGRATQAPGNARADFDAAFGPNRTHMGGKGTTWAERQASNQSAIDEVRKQRGMDLPY